eukprot:s2226_g5.t1
MKNSSGEKPGVFPVFQAFGDPSPEVTPGQYLLSLKDADEDLLSEWALLLKRMRNPGCRQQGCVLRLPYDYFSPNIARWNAGNMAKECRQRPTSRGSSGFSWVDDFSFSPLRPSDCPCVHFPFWPKPVAAKRHRDLCQAGTMALTGFLLFAWLQFVAANEPSLRGARHLGDASPAHAGCFVRKGNQMLVVKLTYGGRKYDIPGGQTNWREPASRTAERETWEESGYRVNAGGRLATVRNHFRIYECYLQDDHPGKGHDHEISEVRWMNADEVRREMNRGMWRFQRSQAYLYLRWLGHSDKSGSVETVVKNSTAGPEQSALGAAPVLPRTPGADPGLVQGNSTQTNSLTPLAPKAGNATNSAPRAHEDDREVAETSGAGPRRLVLV